MSMIEERGIRLNVFNSEDFRRKISDTSNSLKSFDKRLGDLNKKTFDGTRFEKGLKQVSGANGIQGLAKGIDLVSARFDALGIVGATIINRLTNSVINFGHKIVSNIISPLTTGGWQRALNIEQARFQLEGLFGDKTVKVMEDGKKKVVKITEEIEKNAMDAVDSTAYGFDSSVRVASQLAASGVKAGEEMTNALKGVAGMSAMTGSSFDDMGQIFTTVAGNGRLLSEQLLQFSARGMNAAVTIRDFLNRNEDIRKKVIEAGLTGTNAKEVREFADATKLSEKNVRSLVSGGAIDFKTFSMAMSDAFGEHAKKANDTFTGSLSNLKAALARIGADVALEQLKNLRDIFNSITPVINNVRKALKPFIKDLNSTLKGGTDVITTFFKTLADSNYANDKAIKTNLTLRSLAEGVTYLKTAMNNIGGSVSRVISLIAEAFKEVIDINPGRVFLNVAESFANFTSVLSKNSQLAVNIKDTFRGLFTILNFFLDILGRAFKLLFPFLETGGSFVELFFSITGAIGRFVVKFDEMLYKTGIAKTVFNTLTSLVQGFLSVWKAAAHGFSDFFSGLGKTNRIEEAFKGLTSSAKELGTLPNFISAVFKHISSGVSGGMKAITEALNTANFDPIIDLFSGGALMAMAANINRLIQAFTFNLSTQGLSGKIKLSLEDLQKVLISYSAKLNSESLKNVAISIAILAGSLLVLSSLDSAKLLKSVAAMEVLFIELNASMSMLAGLGTGLRGAASLMMISTVFRTIATAVLILAAALRLIGSMSWDELLGGVVAIKVLMKTLTASIAELSSDTPKFIAGTTSMITMAIAINLLAVAVRRLGGLDYETLAKGLGSVAIMMKMLSQFAASLNVKSGFGIKTAVGLIALSISLNLMAKAVKAIGSLDTETIVKGLIGLGAVLMEMSFFIQSIESSGNLISSAVTIAAMALFITQLAKSFESFAGMSWEEIGRGLAAVAGSLLIFASAINYMAMAEGNMLAGAAAMIAMGIALRLITPAFQALGSMDLISIGKALLALGGAFAVLGIAASLLTPLIGPILALSGAIALMGVGVAALGAGLILFSTGAGLFVAALTTLVVGLAAATGGILSAIASILAQIASAVPSLVAAGAKIVVGFLKGLADNIGKIAKAAATFIVAFVKGITDNLPKIIDAAFKLIITFIDGLATAIEENQDAMLDAIGHLLVAMLDLLIDAGSRIKDAAIKLGKKIPAGIKAGVKALPGIIRDFIGRAILAIAGKAKNFLDTGIKFAGKLVSGFTKKAKDLIDYAKSFPGKVLEKIKGKVKDFRDAGENMINGVIEGFKGMFDNALQAVASFGSGLVKSFKDSLGIKSPSRKFFECAVYCIKGFTNAIVQKGSKAYDAVHDMGTTLVRTMSSALSKTYDLASSELSLDPTIRPVVDMTNVKAASKTMDDVFASPTFGLTTPSTGIRLAETIAADIQNGGNLNVASQLGRLTKRLDSVTQAMNSRQMNNYFQIDGSSDPEGFADAVAGRLELNARTL